MSIVTCSAHISSGVKVYVVVPAVDVFITDGFHDPVTPLSDVVGRSTGVAPTQNVLIGANIGMIAGFTSTVIVVVLAHSLASGVNV